MKAIVIHEYGGTDVLKYGDVEKPLPAAGEILVKVRVAAVNTAETGESSFSPRR